MYVLFAFQPWRFESQGAAIHAMFQKRFYFAYFTHKIKGKTWAWSWSHIDANKWICIIVFRSQCVLIWACMINTLMWIDSAKNIGQIWSKGEWRYRPVETLFWFWIWISECIYDKMENVVKDNCKCISLTMVSPHVKPCSVVCYICS